MNLSAVNLEEKKPAALPKVTIMRKRYLMIGIVVGLVVLGAVLGFIFVNHQQSSAHVMGDVIRRLQSSKALSLQVKAFGPFAPTGTTQMNVTVYIFPSRRANGTLQIDAYAEMNDTQYYLIYRWHNNQAYVQKYDLVNGSQYEDECVDPQDLPPLQNFFDSVWNAKEDGELHKSLGCLSSSKAIRLSWANLPLGFCLDKIDNEFQVNHVYSPYLDIQVEYYMSDQEFTKVQSKWLDIQIKSNANCPILSSTNVLHVNRRLGYDYSFNIDFNIVVVGILGGYNGDTSSAPFNGKCVLLTGLNRYELPSICTEGSQRIAVNLVQTAWDDSNLRNTIISQIASWRNGIVFFGTAEYANLAALVAAQYMSTTVINKRSLVRSVSILPVLIKNPYSPYKQPSSTAFSAAILAIKKTHMGVVCGKDTSGTTNSNIKTQRDQNLDICTSMWSSLTFFRVDSQSTGYVWQTNLDSSSVRDSFFNAGNQLNSWIISGPQKALLTNSQVAQTNALARTSEKNAFSYLKTSNASNWCTTFNRC